MIKNDALKFAIETIEDTYKSISHYKNNDGVECVIDYGVLDSYAKEAIDILEGLKDDAHR